MSSSRRRFCIAVLVLALAVVLAFTVIACKKSGTTNNPNTGDKNTSGPVSDDYKSEEVSKTEWNKAFAAVYSAKANASNFTAKASSYGEGKGAASGEKVTSDVTLKIAGGKISYNEVYAEGDYSEEYETYYEYVTAESAWYEYSFDEEADGWNKVKSAEYAASSTVDDFGSLAFVLKENGLSDYADYTFNSSKGRYETTVEDKKGATYTAYVKFKDASIAYAYIEFENDDFSGNYEIFWYDYGTTKVTLPTAGEPEAPETYYTVTFDTQGGSAMASVEVKEGAIIGDVTTPVKQCARFLGFAKDAAGKETWDLTRDTVTGNITLYAIWEDAHTWGAWKTVSEPTCTAEGMRKRICDKCGDDETESIPALGHDFEEEYTVDAEPDCETKGSESRHCTRCDATTDSREIEALGHNYTVWAYDDTEHWKVCSRCGGISEKTGHVYQESGKCECGATEITPESEFTFNDLGEDTYSLAGYSGTRENIRIPATYNGGTVVSIESSAFANCTGITSVIVPDSVTSIGEGAFAGCSSLENITIPFVGAEAGKTSKDTYQYPLGYIFGTDSYTGGTEVTQSYYGSSTSYTTSNTYYIPSSLRSVTVTGGNILYGAFYNCSMITSVTIPDSVTAIGGYAFYNCTGLTSMPIPDSVTSIGRSALSGCTGLTSVTIPESLTNMQNSAFDNCTGLTSVYYTGDIAGWCGITFGNRSSTPLYYAGKLYIDGQLVTDLVIPDSVTKIKDYAFSGYTGLTSVNTGNSVTSIGDSAFSGCTGLTSVTIGNSVTSIGDYAFNNCTGLTSATIGNSVTSIGSSAFSGCTGLTSLTIGSSVTNIGDYAFRDCTGLKSVYYTGDIAGWCAIRFKQVSSSDDVCSSNPLVYADEFYIGDRLVKDIVIPDSVTEIKDYAFDNFVGLTTVTIPGSVKTIGNYAFRNCTGLKAVYYTGDVANWCAIEFYTIDSNPLQYAGNLYIDGQLVTDLVIPDSVTEINAYAFYGCTGLTSVTISETLTSIGSSAFYDCYKLVEIYNKSSLSITAGSRDNGYVGYYAKNVYTEESGSRFTDTADGYRFFHDGTDVYLVGYYGEETEITLPSSFVAYDGSTVNTYNIGDYAFYGNTSITSLTITDSVVGIGENAFCQTRSLRNLVIEPGIEALPQGFLYGCSSLESITIPFVGAEAGKTSSDTYQYPFGYIFGTSSYTGGTGVRQLYYGNSTSSTTYSRYYIPSSLRSVTVTGGNILAGAFYDCSMLTSVTLPETLTSIGVSAFLGCTGLTSVTIGNSVTSIGDSAFYNCTGLTSVTVGNAVTSIGRNAFDNCYKLVEVYNKSSLNITAGDSSYGDVGYYAKNVYTEENGSWFTDTADGYRFLYDGTKGYLVSYYGEATDITLPESFSAYDGTTVNTYEIYQYAFYGNIALASVVIPDSVTSIGDYAFSGCTGLISVTIGNSVISIGYEAFRGCKGLNSVTIPDSVNSIEGGAFRDCTGLTSVTIGNSVTSIGDYAFNNCTGITSVTIGNSVTSIGDYAFSGCTGLTSVTIPGSVMSIGEGAFSGCTSLYRTENGIRYVDRWVVGCDSSVTTEVTLSADTAGISENALYYVRELEFVHYVGDMAGWCSINGLENIPKKGISLYIDGQKIEGELIIPDSVTEIKEYAFSGCTGLTSVIIPDSVTRIGEGAFSGCSSLESITIPFVGAEAGKTSKDTYQYPFGYIFGTDSYTGGRGVMQYYGNSTSYTMSITYYIPSSLRNVTVTGGNILYGAFYGCSMLTSVTIPETVTSIGERAFYNCTGLSSINYTGDIAAWCGIDGLGNITGSGRTLYIGGQKIEGELIIPDSVTEIKEYAFSGCAGLTSVTIPDSVTSIGEGAFSGCSSLESITIPFVGKEAGNTSSEAYQYLFGYIFGTDSYTGGTQVEQYYYGSHPFYPDVIKYYIPSSLRSVTVTDGNIPVGAFSGCSMLTTVTLPEMLTSIGDYTFRNCTGLTSVTIGNSVASIGDYAFYNCTGLTSLTIGNSVASIGNSAFYGCTGLISLIIPAEVTDIGYSAFSGCSAVSFYCEAISQPDGWESSWNPDDRPVVWAHNNITTDADYDYTIHGEMAYLTRYKGNATDIVIPSVIDGKTVAGFGTVYKGNTSITSIVIPDSVTSIGAYAFAGCTGLSSVTIPDSVIIIGDSAFSRCNGLTSVSIGSGVTSIGDSAFEYCSIISVVIPDSVTYIGGYAFQSCDSLAFVTIGSGVTEIEDYAFVNSSRIREIYNRSSINIVAGSFDYGYLGYNALHVYTDENGSWLTHTDDGYTFLYDGEKGYLIGYYGAAAEITLPESFIAYDGTTVDTYEIHRHAFSGNTALTTVIISHSVTAIGSYAFENCTGLTSIIISASVDRIAIDVFRGCGSLTIYCEAASKPEGWHSSWNSGNRPVVWAHNNITADADYDYTVHGDVAYLTRYKGSATEVVIPSAIDGKTVTGLGTAFKGNTSVTSVVIPNSVTSIGSSAFSGCLSLNSIYYAGDIAGWCAMISYGNILDNNRMLYIGGQPVEGDLVIPDSVTGIGDYAFSGYTKLTSVTIQNSVTSVGNYAFRNCTGLTSVTIPDSVTRIGLCAFSGCSSLERMTIPFAGAEAGKTSSDSYQYPFGYIFGTDSYIGGTKVDQRYYGSSTSYTTSTAYYIPSGLRSVTVTGVDILYGAFYGCSMLTSVIIGDGAESIGNSAFWSCTGLTSVTIGKSVESIEYDAFYHCYRLVEVYNKSSLDITAGSGSNGDVGYYAKHVYTEENGSWFTDTTDGYRFLYDGAKGYLVSYYGGATDITLPDSFTAYDGTTVNSYEINQYVFYWNTALTSVVIPDSVTSIGYKAFYGCTGLTSVTIGNSVASIGDNAFYGCTGLTSVTIGNSVASIGDYAFYDCTGLTSVVFEDTEGWQVSRNSGFSSYTSLASTDLADASTAATYLKSRYYSYYWRKVAA